MIVDPAMVLLKTSTLLVPTATPTSDPKPLPTVLPDKPDYQVAHTTGQRTLWVVFIIFVVSSAIFAGLSWRVPIQKRLYHVITTLITVVAALSYFAMATGHGTSLHHIVINEPHDHVPDTQHEIYRQIFFARYIDWAITTPLLLLDLAILAGLSGGSIVITIIADVIMIVTGLFAAYGNEGTPQKWGWYTIAVLSYLVVVWHLAFHGRANATARGDRLGKFYVAIGAFTLILWTLYPIVWGIADGARRISVDAEIICYAVLDVLAKVVFGTWLIISHAKIPEIQTELGGWWAHGFNNEGTLRLDDDDGA